MDKLYQEGGLADDGTNIEPVTGNEVPTGSMDQEVRDNIPAQLSEGEYVVPADVVRYYGVKFFEDLRGQAKQDFARMEAEGRVGGEPVDTNGMPMEQDEELTPEEMQMLAEALGQSPTGMAMGGMVPQQQQAMYNPYEQQQTQYTPPAPVFQSTRTGMQEGGLAQEALEGYTGPTFDPSQYSYGGGFSSPFGEDTSTSSGGMEIKEYVNPDTGQTRMITVLNGEPIGLVPDGFIPASQEAKQQAQETKQEVETKTEGARVGMGGKDSADVGPEAPEAPDFGEMSDEQLGQAHSNITGPEKTMANMLGAVPGVGRLATAVNTKMKKDVEEEMAKRNIDIPEKKDVSLMDTISSIFSGGVKGMSASEIESQTMDTISDMVSMGFGSEGMSASDVESQTRDTISDMAAMGFGSAPSDAGGTGSGGSGGSSGGAGGSGGPGPGGEPGGAADRAEGGLMGKPEGSQNKKRKANQRKKPIKNRKGLASK